MTTETPTKPAPRGRKPQDHKQKDGAAAEALEAKREREQLLADLPDLTPAHELRFRERARIKEIVAEAVGRGVFREGEDGIEFNVESAEDRARLTALYDVVGRIDEFAESIARDVAAYTAWSRDKTEAHFFAILTRYDEAVGESNGS